MDKVSGKLTVFFEVPFWVGVFERVSDGKLSVCKVTFGAEPKDYEIYDFVLKNYHQLRFSPAVATDVKEAGRNPKRVQREVQKQVQSIGIGTKSQQALKLQQEQLKTERKTVNREQWEAEKQRQFELKQQKRKGKHRWGISVLIFRQLYFRMVLAPCEVYVKEKTYEKSNSRIHRT